MTFQFTPSDDVRHAIADGVLTVSVERPEKRNPLSLGVLDSIRRIFTELAEDERIRVAVMTGAGDKAFASGGDLRELYDYRSREDAEAFSRHGKAALDAIRRFPVPVIARLNGLALGGGAELALACDQRYAAHHVKIGFVHGRLAISPSWGGGVDLVRLLGQAKALRMMATAAALDATEAQSLGVIDLVCPQGEDFDAWFAAHIAAYAAHPRQVARAFKAIATRESRTERSELDKIETRHFVDVWAHKDHWDAVTALERSRK